MTSEDKEIIRKIQHLTGRIDRRKQRQRPDHTPYTSITGSGQQLTTSGTESDTGGVSDASGPSWITRSHRHLQLINSSAYKSESPKRTAAPGRVYKSRDRADRGRPGPRSSASVQSRPSANHDQEYIGHKIKIDGLDFSVAANGKKLIRVSGDPNLVPKIATVAGVEFQRTKNGNLIKKLAKAQVLGNRTKLDVPCRYFSTAGSCPQGPHCRYQHDISRVAICKTWLLQRYCPKGDHCDLSHEATLERVPSCVHFAKGSCNNTNCVYSHVDLAPDAQNCRAFGLYGYCEKGSACPERHSFECPDFANTGTCGTRSCKLVHRERASVLRKAATAAAAIQQNNSGNDKSCSDNGEHTSDADSIDLDELMPLSNDSQDDFVEQSDFIRF